MLTSPLWIFASEGSGTVCVFANDIFESEMLTTEQRWLQTSCASHKTAIKMNNNAISADPLKQKLVV